MKLLFVADPLESFKTYKDSTFAMMRFFGVDCGPTRPPLQTLDDAAVARLEEDLEQVGFFTAVRGGSAVNATG